MVLIGNYIWCTDDSSTTYFLSFFWQGGSVYIRVYNTSISLTFIWQFQKNAISYCVMIMVMV